MIAPTWSPDVLRWITEGLEAGFSVGDPSYPEHPGKWGVLDAEMQVVAVCETEALAEIVCSAMNDYDADITKRWFDEASAIDNAEPVQTPNPDAPDETEPQYADDEPPQND